MKLPSFYFVLGFSNFYVKFGKRIVKKIAVFPQMYDNVHFRK